MRRGLLPGLLGGPPIAGLAINDEAGLGFTAFEIRELEVMAPREAFDAEVAAAEEAVREGRTGDMGPARALYRSFGTDPTRHRPSSEALLRRVRKGEGLPRINSLVDVANLLSLELQVPVGLYDLAKIEGEELVIRMGREGEGYAGIGKEHVNVEGRLCVADAAGPCGNPSSDSARTMITTATGAAAWIYFLPVDDVALRRTAELVATHGRGIARFERPPTIAVL
jgi:DNA/RNA-binding domain of Phe-tRNA-synthetase-like protein